MVDHPALGLFVLSGILLAGVLQPEGEQAPRAFFDTPASGIAAEFVSEVDQRSRVNCVLAGQPGTDHGDRAALIIRRALHRSDMRKEPLLRRAEVLEVR
jgi:hypothetical protein